MYLEVNVTRIVKYVSLAGVSIVAIVFGTKAYKEYLQTKYQREKA